VVVNAVTPTALRLAPSLLISAEEIDLAVDAIGVTLTDLAAASTETNP
jgi:acetylornithine aminotransferase